MAFHKIDMETWPRREHYIYYSEKIKTSYQMNVDIDVTELVGQCKKRKLRFYPVMIYVIMKAVNSNRAFRLAVDRDDRLGYYDVCHPSYTIFHKDDQTFSDIWTQYDEDFQTFYDAAVRDMEQYKDVKGIKAKPDRPDAFTPISCVPWVSFNSVSHDTPGPHKMYFPVITFGKYKSSGENRLLPFSVFVNHAAADGYHTSKLINDIQENCSSCSVWIGEQK